MKKGGAVTETYSLMAYIPYQSPDCLFSGTEEELRSFIQTNRGINVYKTVSGREIKSTAIAGYLLDDLEVMIEGPDVRTYLE